AVPRADPPWSEPATTSTCRHGTRPGVTRPRAVGDNGRVLCTLPDHVPTLDEPRWRHRAATHAERVRHTLAGHHDRARRGVKHPVEDFLFGYYRTRPAHLHRWSPGHGVALEGDTGDLGHLPLVPVRGGAARVVDPEALRPRQDGVRWIAQLLERTAHRPPQLGCFGLHEWAMVHRTSSIRHEQLELRLSQDEIAAVLERRGVACTHIDAYRFFTPAAL